jgi:hypothetical protein
MESLTKKEMLLIAHLLEIASDKFSNHGCNDMDEEIMNQFTSDEKDELSKQYHDWNGDPEEFTPGLFWLGDDSLMSLFAAKLKKMMGGE